MAKFKINNPALDEFQHSLKANVYRILGRKYDFRTIDTKTLQKLADDDRCKLINRKPKSAASDEGSETGKKTSKKK